jgi:hypothetical protein
MIETMSYAATRKGRESLQEVEKIIQEQLCVRERGLERVRERGKRERGTERVREWEKEERESVCQRVRERGERECVSKSERKREGKERGLGSREREREREISINLRKNQDSYQAKSIMGGQKRCWAAEMFQKVQRNWAYADSNCFSHLQTRRPRNAVMRAARHAQSADACRDMLNAKITFATRQEPQVHSQNIHAKRTHIWHMVQNCKNNSTRVLSTQPEHMRPAETYILVKRKDQKPTHGFHTNRLFFCFKALRKAWRHTFSSCKHPT